MEPPTAVTSMKTVTFSYKTKSTPLYKVPKGQKWDENDPNNPAKQVDNRRVSVPTIGNNMDANSDYLA